MSFEDTLWREGILKKQQGGKFKTNNAKSVKVINSDIPAELKRDLPNIRKIHANESIVEEDIEKKLHSSKFSRRPQPNIKQVKVLTKEEIPINDEMPLEDTEIGEKNKLFNSSKKLHPVKKLNSNLKYAKALQNEEMSLKGTQFEEVLNNKNSGRKKSLSLKIPKRTQGLTMEQTLSEGKQLEELKENKNSNQKDKLPARQQPSSRRGKLLNEENPLDRTLFEEIGESSSINVNEFNSALPEQKNYFKSIPLQAKRLLKLKKKPLKTNKKIVPTKCISLDDFLRKNDIPPNNFIKSIVMKKSDKVKTPVLESLKNDVRVKRVIKKILKKEVLPLRLIKKCNGEDVEETPLLKNNQIKDLLKNENDKLMFQFLGY